MLKALGTHHKFRCLRLTNLPAESIETFVDSIASSTSLKEYKCIAFCFSGHGGDGVIYGQDNGQSPAVIITNEILLPFDPQKAPHLRDIPKLFFIDACRGSGQESGKGKGLVQRAYKGGSGGGDSDDLLGGYIIGYSTMPGYKSWLRGEEKVGSIWMPVLAEMLQQDSERDILGVLRDVNIAVEEEFTFPPKKPRLLRKHHQQPEFDCTFSGGSVNLFKIAKGVIN